MAIIYKTIKAKEKFADSLVSLGDKLFWSSLITLLGYFFNLKSLSEFDLGIFMIVILISYVFVYIGIKMSQKGFEIYDEIELSQNQI